MKKEPLLRSALWRHGNRAMKVYSVLLVIVFSLPTSSFSQVQFTTHIITTGADNPRSVYAVDVNGDGNMDVLSASVNDHTVAWYENDGNENFTSHIVTTDVNGPNSVYAADVNGDGYMDVLSSSHFDSKIAWYENDGSEKFSAHTITTNASGARTVYAADVDGDGDMDVLSASSWDDKIAWYENDGSENFSAHTITTNADYAWSVYATDLDGDGDMDVLSTSGWDDKIAWYENDGNEKFTSHIVTTDVNGPNSVYAVDVNGDGYMDVLSANGCSDHDGEIAWYENDGSKNFTAHAISTGLRCALSVYAVDIDADEDMDVLSAAGGDDEVAWYENDGSEHFTAHTITTNADGVRSVYAVDVDGDGDMDVLSASEIDDKIAWYENLSSPISVEIDIKPGSDTNCLNMNGNGVIPVAILGSDSFDIANVDQPSLAFGGLDVRIRGKKGPLCSGEYSNADAYLDLVCKFEDDASAWSPGSEDATLTGTLLDGSQFEGTDTICVVP